MVTAVIVSQGSQAKGRSGAAEAQELFSVVTGTLDEIQTTLTAIRFRRYVTAAGGDLRKALLIYRWNSFLSQSLYWPIQTLEIAYRNSISKVLTNSFGQNWHLAQRFHRQLDRDDADRLREVVSRHQRDRRTRTPPVDGVVAELTLGFWTAMLTRRYAIPLAWGRNLNTAFPYLPAGLGTQSVLQPMERTRILRNRIAHHEPIFDRRLHLSHREILDVLGWICPATRWYVEQTSTFPELWATLPR
jgi:hypothetical protein